MIIPLSAYCSVPVLQNLSDEKISKISDVVEVVSVVQCCVASLDKRDKVSDSFQCTVAPTEVHALFVSHCFAMSASRVSKFSLQCHC